MKKTFARLRDWARSPLGMAVYEYTLLALVCILGAFVGATGASWIFG